MVLWSRFMLDVCESSMIKQTSLTETWTDQFSEHSPQHVSLRSALEGQAAMKMPKKAGKYQRICSESHGTTVMHQNPHVK